MAAGDKTLWADVALMLNRPRVRLVATTSQSIPHNVAAGTALQFPSEAYDNYGFHDPVTNNTRITPNVAGWYTVRGAIHMPARADWTLIQAWYRKNGAVQWESADRNGTTGNVAQSRSPQAALMDFNGSTDYVELVMHHTNTAAVAVSTTQSVQLSAILEVIYEGPL